MKKLLSLILASLILSMSAAMVSADEAEAAPAETAPAETTETTETEATETEAETTAPAETTEAPAESEAAAPAEDAAESEIMLISEETEAAESETATEEPAPLKILTEGEEGYAAAKVEGQTSANIVTVWNNQGIDALRLLDHNENTGISYTSSPDGDPILNLAFELEEADVLTSVAFSCSVDTAGAVNAILYGTNDPELKDWTCIDSEPAEAGEGFYNYNTVGKYVRKFKYYLVSLAFAPVNAETGEIDETLPAVFYLSEVELLKEAPEEPTEVKNNLPQFPIFNSNQSLINHIG